MGTNCCASNTETTDMRTEVYEEKEDKYTVEYVNLNTQMANLVKSSTMHHSRLHGRKTKFETTVKITERDEKQDSLGLLSGKSRLETENFLRLPTNFKIEPAQFRGERIMGNLEDKYELGPEIGSGSYGTVRKIKEKTTGSYRALKTMGKKDCQKTDNFADEIEIIKRLVFINIKLLGSSKRCKIL